MALRLARLVAAERRITAADGDGIVRRWQYGRALLADPELTTPAGTLRRGRGIVERLTAAAAASGLRLSEREIQYRLECARAYPTEAAISHARARYATWDALRTAGFPAAPEDAAPALMTTDGADVEPAALPVQPPLDGFPPVLSVAGAIVPLHLAPLSAMAAYCRSSERWTSGHQRADERRRAELDRLTAAAREDLSVSIGQARALADAGAA